MTDQKQFEGHYFLSSRNQGAAKLLLGECVIQVLLVNDTTSHWTPEAKEEYMACLDATIQVLSREADRRYLDLQIRRTFREITLEENCGMGNAKKWRPLLRSALHYAKVSDYQAWYTNEQDCDEAPVLCVFNKNERSFAYGADAECLTADEYSGIFRDDDDGVFSITTTMHELLHLFGAMDYYYPEEVEESACRNFPDSIMNDGEEIDSLTAYLIGWTDELDEDACAFLEDTKHLTVEMVRAARDKA